MVLFYATTREGMPTALTGARQAPRYFVMISGPIKAVGTTVESQGM